MPLRKRAFFGDIARHQLEIAVCDENSADWWGTTYVGTRFGHSGPGPVKRN